MRAVREREEEELPGASPSTVVIQVPHSPPHQPPIPSLPRRRLSALPRRFRGYRRLSRNQVGVGQICQPVFWGFGSVTNS